MFCNKCGDPVEHNEKYCNKCGNPLNVISGPYTSINPTNNNLEQNNRVGQSKTNQKKMIITGFSIGILFVLFVSRAFSSSSLTYFFDKNSSGGDDEIIITSGTTSKKGKYETSIIYDNTYSQVKINNSKDAIYLITKDSVNQKDKCPKDIINIEDDMINKYKITAVNLCEMNVDFAKELGNVFYKIYNEYSSVRGYITNLTLVNTNMSNNYIAAFMPVFNFATSSTSSTYPWVIKTQVLLNTAYFLNEERLEASVNEGSKSGHFPKNSTVYSPVAHELGHYLSFLAMMRNHNLESILLVDSINVSTFYNLYDDFVEGNYSLIMINEAYDKYKRDTKTTMSLDEWRGTISNYALAKDNSGNYIYDETIAESFHDVYLNGNNASTASKYVVSVLKEKLGS